MGIHFPSSCSVSGVRKRSGSVSGSGFLFLAHSWFRVQFWFGPAEPVCDKGSVLLNQFWHRVELCWTKFCVHFGNPVWNRFRPAEQIWNRGSLQITAGLDFNPDGLSETQPYGFWLTGSAYWCDWLRIWGTGMVSGGPQKGSVNRV